ncbi:hypothetical protein VP01_11349g1, partial [Puccinia sorghi]
MKRRQALRTKEPLKLANTAPITTSPMADWEKKLETVTKQLAAFTSWRNPPPHLMSGTNSAPTPASYRDLTFKFYYCFQQNHRLVKKLGRNYLLPDNSEIPWNTSRSIKELMDNYAKKANLTEGIYEAELGKRTGASKEQEEQQGMKRNKRQTVSVTDVDEEIFEIANTPLSTLDPSSQSFQPANK